LAKATAPPLFCGGPHDPAGALARVRAEKLHAGAVRRGRGRHDLPADKRGDVLRDGTPAEKRESDEGPRKSVPRRMISSRHSSPQGLVFIACPVPSDPDPPSNTASRPMQFSTSVSPRSPARQGNRIIQKRNRDVSGKKPETFARAPLSRTGLVGRRAFRSWTLCGGPLALSPGPISNPGFQACLRRIGGYTLCDR